MAELRLRSQLASFKFEEEQRQAAESDDQQRDVGVVPLPLQPWDEVFGHG